MFTLCVADNLVADKKCLSESQSETSVCGGVASLPLPMVVVPTVLYLSISHSRFISSFSGFSLG